MLSNRKCNIGFGISLDVMTVPDIGNSMTINSTNMDYRFVIVQIHNFAETHFAKQRMYKQSLQRLCGYYFHP